MQGGTVQCEGRDDAEEFAEIRSAMKVICGIAGLIANCTATGQVLEMTDQEIWDVLKVLAALLHMGNIKYKVMA